MRKAALMFAGVALVTSAAYSGDGAIRRSDKRIPGRYIVALESGADTATVAEKVRKLKGARVLRTYERGFKGFALELSEADALALAGDASVQFIEEDSIVSAAATPWGLDRIDQRALPLNNSYVSEGTGAGVRMYIVDSGIMAGHSEFGGRVTSGYDALNDGRGTSDCDGHGTHVAGIAAGATFGVAKSATIVPVRVLDCIGTGSLSNVVAGLEWILVDALASKPSVVNMSLGGAPSTALDLVIGRLITAGLTTVVAAGNGNSDACRNSPARVAGAITVGASTEADQRASFSNYGACVDLFAPGSNIVSASISSTAAAVVGSGTSAAAPFVAGTAALYLEKYPTASAAIVSQSIVSRATQDALGSVGPDSPNRLLFSLVGSLNESEVPSNVSQLLADPGFEYGDAFWKRDLCTGSNPAGCTGIDNQVAIGDFVSLQTHPALHGKARVQLGGASKSFSLVSETVKVPVDARKAEFSVYLWVVTKNIKQSASDVLTVEIRDAAGKLLETVGTFSNLDASPTYVKRTFDVSRYRGTSIRVSFAGAMGNGAPTWFLLDDAALNAWR